MLSAMPLRSSHNLRGHLRLSSRTSESSAPIGSILAYSAELTELNAAALRAAVELA